MQNLAEQDKIMIFPSISYCEVAVIHDKDSNQYLGFHIDPSSDLDHIKDQVNTLAKRNHSLHFVDIVAINENTNHENFMNSLVNNAGMVLKNTQSIQSGLSLETYIDQQRRNIVFIPKEKTFYFFDENRNFVQSIEVFNQE